MLDFLENLKGSRAIFYIQTIMTSTCNRHQLNASEISTLSNGQSVRMSYRSHRFSTCLDPDYEYFSISMTIYRRQYLAESQGHCRCRRVYSISGNQRRQKHRYFISPWHNSVRFYLQQANRIERELPYERLALGKLASGSLAYAYRGKQPDLVIEIPRSAIRAWAHQSTPG